MNTGELNVGGRPLTIETGKLAKQANGSVVVRYGDTMVLVTACYSPHEREGIDFLPLTVDYRENTYASGRIPGGFFKREGKPPEKEVLTSRVIDRPIRPLFPAGWRRETQIVAFVISADKENDSDVLALTGASAALALSKTFGNAFQGGGGVQLLRLLRLRLTATQLRARRSGVQPCRLMPITFATSRCLGAPSAR